MGVESVYGFWRETVGRVTAQTSSLTTTMVPSKDTGKVEGAMSWHGKPWSAVKARAIGCPWRGM